MEDKEAIELYKEISKVHAKISIDVAEKLDDVARNLKEMNDKNILHQQEVMNILKIVSSRYFKIILALVIVLSIVAIGEKAIDVFKAIM